MSFVDDDSCSNNATPVRQRQIEFLEKEILKRDQKIQLLQGQCEAALREGTSVKRELSAAKSYIDTLPTQQEVEKLKRLLANSRDEQKQSALDLDRIKQKNAELSSELASLNKTVSDLKASLQNKSDEAQALQFTVQLWEQRRKAAKEAGQVTVEDVLAEKMKLEDHLQNVLKIASCREQHLKARMDTMKAFVEEEQRSAREAQKSNALLKTRVSELELDLREALEECGNLRETNQGLRGTIDTLTSHLEDAKARIERRSQTDETVRRCLLEIHQCNQGVEMMLDFIRNAMQTGNFLDPSLLFPPFQDAEVRHCRSRTNEDDEDLQEEAEQRIKEVEELKKNLKNCQKLVTDLYVANLSSSVSKQCHIQ